MRKRLAFGIALVSLVAVASSAVELGPFSIGFHLNPAVDAGDGPRVWGLSLSLGVGATVGDLSWVDMLVIVDSEPSSLGLTVRYGRELTEPFTAGFGLSMFWAFDADQHAVQSLFGGFAYALAQGNVFADLRGEIGASFPLLTLAHYETGWDILPLAELPSLHVAGDWSIVERGGIEMRATFQPVIVDTTQFVRPIGRIGEHLLILPTYSAFLRYSP